MDDMWFEVMGAIYNSPNYEISTVELLTPYGSRILEADKAIEAMINKKPPYIREDRSNGIYSLTGEGIDAFCAEKHRRELQAIIDAKDAAENKEREEKEVAEKKEQEEREKLNIKIQHRHDLRMLIIGSLLTLFIEHFSKIIQWIVSLFQ